MRYYLVSYAHNNGFGNMFFKSEPYLNIRDAERKIAEDIDGIVCIIAINEIDKSQFVEAKKA